MAATCPGSIVPLADGTGLSGTHFSQGVVMSSSSMPTASAIIGTVPPHAMTRISGISRGEVSSGRRPVVGQRVRCLGDQRLDVVGGDDAGRCEPADLAHIATDLVRIGDSHSYELELRLPQDLGDDHPADEPGAPHHHPLAHLGPPTDRWFSGRPCPTLPIITARAILAHTYPCPEPETDPGECGSEATVPRYVRLLE